MICIELKSILVWLWLSGTSRGSEMCFHCNFAKLCFNPERNKPRHNVKPICDGRPEAQVYTHIYIYMHVYTYMRLIRNSDLHPHQTSSTLFSFKSKTRPSKATNSHSVSLNIYISKCILHAIKWKKGQLGRL